MISIYVDLCKHPDRQDQFDAFVTDKVMYYSLIIINTKIQRIEINTTKNYFHLTEFVCPASVRQTWANALSTELQIESDFVKFSNILLSDLLCWFFPALITVKVVYFLHLFYSCISILFEITVVHIFK